MPTDPRSPVSGEPSDLPPLDAIVIGAGSGGLTVAAGLSHFGRRVALVERQHVGGDCTHTGCIPSKALLHQTAELRDTAQLGDTAQLRGTAQLLPSSSADVLAVVRERRDRLGHQEAREYGSNENIDLIFGEARLIAPGAVQVTGADGLTRTLEADHVVVATGSRPRRLAVEGLPDARYLTNEELFELDAAPRRMVIVGAGPIGMEMALAFARLGTEITVLDAAPQILPAVLPEAAAVLERSLEAQDIRLKPGFVAHRFDSVTSSLLVGPPGGEVTERIADVDKVLVAVGRLPNSERLGLEDLGVETDQGRIVVDEKSQTSVKGVWAVGDVTTEGSTTHAANAWGRRVVRHIVAPLARSGRRPEDPAVVFTSPEVASIGVQPIEVPGDVRRINFDLSTSDRAYTDDVADGMIIVDIRRLTGRVMGATIVGPRAGELISIFSFAMKAGVPFHKWYGTVWPYPSYADALGAVVDEYMKSAMKNVPGDGYRWLRARLGGLRR